MERQRSTIGIVGRIFAGICAVGFAVCTIIAFTDSEWIDAFLMLCLSITSVYAAFTGIDLEKGPDDETWRITRNRNHDN